MYVAVKGGESAILGSYALLDQARRDGATLEFDPESHQLTNRDLDRLAERAERQMTEAEESLYAELVGSGSSAWAQLQGTVTSQLTATVHMPDGTSVEHPMTVVRGMATHEDAEVRKAAYEAELEAWPKVTAVCAAAMNGVKGETDAVNRRRGWASPLDASLFANNVDRDTYEAMQQAVVEPLPFFADAERDRAGI